MREVILARHGESEYSARGLLNGDPLVAVGLTEAGRDQAKALGRALRGVRLDVCITSPFPRVLQTADIALDGRDVPREIDQELGDIRVGDFDGRPLTQFREWIGRHGPLAEPPGRGESRLHAIERFDRAFRRIAGREEDTVLVVTHGLPVTVLPMAARGEPPPLTLEGTPTLYATAVRMPRADLERALDVLESWARETVAA